MIYPVFRVKSYVPESPESSIVKAEDVFKSEKSAILINEQFMRQEILKATQNYASVASLSELSDRINSQTQGKLVCVKSSYSSIMNNELADRIRNVSDQIQQAYAANWSRELSQSYQNLQQINQFASNFEMESIYRFQGSTF
jgi:vacuolar-type H+-ATPase catalytic subunit A/Vma1